MSEQTTTLAPSANAPVRCMGCGHTMAPDQRYCLDCGKRKGDPRVAFDQYMGDDQSAAAPPPSPPVPVIPAGLPNPYDPRPVREITPLMAAGGLAAFAVILLLGVIVGRLGDGNSQAPVIAAATPTTAAAPPTTGGTDLTVTFQADWPAGEEGFTVELATVPKDSTDGAGVEATKADLTSKGAGEIGALDSDEYPSLPTGNYVFYSGVFDTRPDAELALAELSTSFPDAQVIEVSETVAAAAKDSGAGGGSNLITDDPAAADALPDKAVQATKDELEEINNLDAAGFQELQDKLPPTIETPGKAPPKDDEAPGGGGGGGAVTIG